MRESPYSLKQRLYIARYVFGFTNALRAILFHATGGACILGKNSLSLVALTWLRTAIYAGPPVGDTPLWR